MASGENQRWHFIYEGMVNEEYVKLKNDFNSILRLRTELQSKRDTLTEKIDEIREQYNELIKHNSKKIYLYCLDSLYFQYKILRVELEQFQKTISLIFNRMYGDYYKLYNIIQSQCKENSTNILLSGESVVVYKDLDPFAEYNLDDLVLTHKIIIETLTKLQVLYSSTLSYENKILGEHISLYSDYLSFYHSSQRKYFEKALYKINGFMREIEDDILTNHKTYKTETITIVEPIVELVFEEPTIVIEEIKPIQAEPKLDELELIESKSEEPKLDELEPIESKSEETKPEESNQLGEPKTEIEEEEFQTVGRGKNGKNKKR